MESLVITLNSEFSLVQFLLVVIPLLATLAGFLSSLGEAAYYRILTECGAPSLQSFALRFVIVGFASIILILVAFQYSAAPQILMIMLLACVVAALLILLYLRREIALPELIIVTLASGVLAIISFLLIASRSDPIVIEELSNESFTRINALWFIAFFVIACGLFYEAGFFLAKYRRIYLIDQSEKWIVLTTCSGGKAFLRSIERIRNDVCNTGEVVRFVPMESLSGYSWYKFKRVTIRPMIDAIRCGDKAIVFHSGGKRFIKRSGVGMAGLLQVDALTKVGCKSIRLATAVGDLIHINTAGFGGALRMLRARRRNIPIVVTAHNIAELLPGTFRFLQSRCIIKIYRRWLAWFYGFADVVIAPSLYVCNKLKTQYGDALNVFINTNGVDVSLFNRVSESSKNKVLSMVNNCSDTKRFNKNKISANSVVVLSVGMTVTRKGIVEFISLAKQMPDYEFVWIGKTLRFAQPKEARRAIYDARKIKNVHFVGYVEHDNLPAFYHLSSAFLFLSSEETEGIVVLEALASKVPIIVSDIPVYDGWLKDGIHCLKIDINRLRSENENVRLKEAARLCQMLDKVIISPDKKMISRGYRLACGKDLYMVGKSLKRIYSSVISIKRV